ncbi:hypothetical protein EZI54_02515 [Marinobacter halodurans]|uniref:Uncharacterized protein n=1 Tax=Marinobacter halodurans TaxID=2528979 RepID=A0ABY1ZPG5_9GAMM|nr:MULTISPECIES: hypothetical protein [Marinobacter]ROT99823.1 hypothetical protein EB809_10105 [Marinobacter sp. R17]TBW58762.1 hypothetical protein EZI54_02515 [Marinobacter halodurans]
MDIGLLFGLFAIAVGLVSLVGRHFAPEKFLKLQILQQKLGKRNGYILHFLAYTVLPLLVGISILIQAYVPGTAS